jgi:uncharacterized protein (UPF0332 family)
VRKLKPQAADWSQIRRFFEGATKKLATAKRILDIDEEASFQQAYEAMLKASLALMLAHGLRPRSLPGHHVAIIEFAGKQLGKQFRDLIAMFDRMRRKRNQALYDVKGLVSKQDAEQALETAAEYLRVIRVEVERLSPQRKLL